MSAIRATYVVDTDEPALALTAICRGQSVGNPSIFTAYETKDFLAKWCATGKIEHESHEGLHVFSVSWPDHNFGTEGLNYLLSVVMGGQCDIDIIRGCRLVRLELGVHERHFPKPRYGVGGLRQLLHIPSRAFVGGIIKPKIGLSAPQLAHVVRQMAEGGCDVIKEDEILADQYWCPMSERLSEVAKAIKSMPLLYLVCVTGDGSEVWKKARYVEGFGKQFGVHCNLWAGLGTYRDIRTHVQCPIFFQKSGDKVWTSGPFAIDYHVLCQLIYLAGCDIAHIGMYGGYLAEPVDILKRRMTALQTVLPSFSCGMTPSLAEQIIGRFGTDLMVTSGGWIHGQPKGIVEAVRVLRRVVDATRQTVYV